MVQFDATIIVQIVNFLVLLAILNQVFYKPMLKVMAERREAQEGAEKSIQSKLGEIANLQETHHRKLDEARQAAHNLVSEQIKQAQQEREVLLGQIAQETTQSLAEARSSLEEEAARTREALAAQVHDVAQLILDRLVGDVVEKEMVGQA